MTPKPQEAHDFDGPHYLSDEVVVATDDEGNVVVEQAAISVPRQGTNTEALRNDHPGFSVSGVRVEQIRPGISADTRALLDKMSNSPKHSSAGTGDIPLNLGQKYKR